ncbi:hypothetical protein LOTGIDRAFT_227338 [Lottia gigantea]|uniref:TBC1 domain family member 7 n=1 Tax=Lottia gigantea TaxID=225164 RepID=V4BZW1_LOTGI|nr:hypothetical protein LOTGIDRAFT_227338 [Lottia gigantea]ESO94704.1 hypothetical protein LOTGIDRAFT_227338 [Lottia gigantea]
MEERNFRQYYYEKFGFRVVEEKKSVEILLKEHHLDIEKLRQFCLRFTLPAMYRLVVWKILLGVLPASQSSQKFVLEQRTQQYKDLHHGLKLLKRIDSNSLEEEVLLKMFLLEQGCLPFEESNLKKDDGFLSFLAIAKGVCSLTDDNVDQYWISTKFFTYFKKFHDNFPVLIDKTLVCLKKEDSDLKLLNHLEQHDILSSLPLISWFRSCFADVLPETSFERIWDKVIGGSCAILVYVAVCIFLTFKRPLLSMNNTDDMVKYLRKIPADCGDKVVNEAIELWQKNGCHMMHPKSESPALDKSI